jgi:acetyltransferase-like isoleucine patch superfamily enzyme
MVKAVQNFILIWDRGVINMNVLKILWNKYLYLKKIKDLKEREIYIEFPSSLLSMDNITFEKNIYIGPKCYISGKGGLKIESNVRIGPHVRIWTENHNYKSKEMLPYDNEDIPMPVTIGANSWIGLGAMVCPGTVIGEGAIIGMGAVVRGNIPPCSIVMGNPGKIVGERDVDTYNTLVKENKFHKLGL